MSKPREGRQEVREPAVAGLFYPANAEALRRDIESFYHEVSATTRSGTIRGIIAPHAGYIYSGYTAACGYARLAGAQYDTVVVIAPSHREYFDGVSVYHGSAYQTPLGSIPVNVALRDRLIGASRRVRASELGHGEEHSIEVHLPFLQAVLPDFQLLPLVVGHQTREVCFEHPQPERPAGAGMEKPAGVAASRRILLLAQDKRMLGGSAAAGLSVVGTDPVAILGDLHSGPVQRLQAADQARHH